ncbi:MAG: response regulator, partial [Rhodospirillales bacterium]|nr:response regulator [Rhodospirillales bacterium]
MKDDAKIKYQIVVVEDDPAMIGIECSLLDANGHEVFPVQQSATALEKIREIMPDCVVADIMMPGVDGMQLLSQIKGDSALARIKVIIVSSKSYEFDRRQAKKLGAGAFVTKPFDIESFAKLVEDVMIDQVQISF